jgi:hypothetical protein
MKRLFVVGVACAALLVPSLASGSSATSVAGHAKRGPAFAIFFDVITKNGKPKKVKNLTFENAFAECEAGGSVFFEFPDPGLGPYKVNDKRKFGKKFPVSWEAKTMKRGSNGSVTVKGEFNRKATKVTGTLRAKGSPAGHTGCDTGKIKWVAVLL